MNMLCPFYVSSNVKKYIKKWAILQIGHNITRISDKIETHITYIVNTIVVPIFIQSRPKLAQLTCQVPTRSSSSCFKKASIENFNKKTSILPNNGRKKSFEIHVIDWDIFVLDTFLTLIQKFLNLQFSLTSLIFLVLCLKCSCDNQLPEKLIKHAT